MADVRGQGSARAAPVVVERGRRVAVVDQQQQALREAAGSARDPGVGCEADLGPLALGERDALGVQAGLERRRRRRPAGIGEAAVDDRHVDLVQAPGGPDDAMRRQRVEHLVPEHEPLDRGLVVRFDDVAEARPQLLEATRLDLHRPVAEGLGEVGLGRPDAVDERRRQRPGAGAVLADRERRRASQRGPHVDREPGDRLAEDRMGLGRREEVAVASRPRGGAAVVAALGVVERELHEPGERHRARRGDLVADRRLELRVALDQVEVQGRDPAEAVHRHRSARRMPGPTSVWPPRTIGTGASSADRVSARSHGSAMRSWRRRSEA